MDIRTSVVEGGEQKACVGKSHHPVSGAVAEGVFLRVIAQARLGQLYGADAGQYVFVYLLGGILHVQTVGGPARHIIGVMDYKDQVIPHVLIVFYDSVIIFLQQLFVLEPAVPQPQQKGLSALLRG